MQTDIWSCLWTLSLPGHRGGTESVVAAGSGGTPGCSWVTGGEHQNCTLCVFVSKFAGPVQQDQLLFYYTPKQEMSKLLVGVSGLSL